MNRRQLITGLVSLVAAPAIVRAGSLMPVKVLPFILPQGHVTLYVNPVTGHDGIGYGWTYDTAVKSIQDAIDKAIALPRDIIATIQLSPGIYQSVDCWDVHRPVIIRGA